MTRDTLMTDFDRAMRRMRAHTTSLRRITDAVLVVSVCTLGMIGMTMAEAHFADVARQIEASQ